MLLSWFRRIHAWLLPRDLAGSRREVSRAHLLVATLLAYLAAAVSTLGIAFACVPAPSAEAARLRWSAIGSAGVAIAAVLAIFRLTGRRLLAANLLAGLLGVLFVAIAAVTGGARGPLPGIFVMVPITATLLGSRRSGLVWALVMFAATGGLRLLEHQGVALPWSLPEVNRRLADDAITAVVFLAVTASLQVYDHLAERLAEALEREKTRYAYLAEHDPLTKLPNRGAFALRVHEAIARARRSGIPFALGYLDLDAFKPINDRFGHAVGDVVLQRIAARLQTCTRTTDAVARLGGDEFGLLLEGVRSGGHAESEGNVESVARKILEKVAQPIAIGRDSVIVTGSLGLVLHPECPGDVEALERLADQAMYHAKAQGGVHRIHRPTAAERGGGTALG